MQVGREMIQWEMAFITELSAIVTVVLVTAFSNCNLTVLSRLVYVQAVSAEMLEHLDPPAIDAFSVFKTSIVALQDAHQIIGANLKRVLKLETGQKGSS